MDTVSEATARPWSYEIQYGPNGEEIYAWVYYHNLMVCTVKVHHARLIVEAVAAIASLERPVPKPAGDKNSLARVCAAALRSDPTIAGDVAKLLSA